MALFAEGTSCPLCGQPMNGHEDLIGFTMIRTDDSVVRRLNDAVCHRKCLGHWEHRDAFVRGWNREAMYGLGPYWFLEVTRSGEVRYLTWLGRLLYRWGWKRSPLLPERIRPSRPDLRLRATGGGYSPLWVHRRYGYAENPPPEAIGLRSESAARVRAWAERYDRLCVRSGGEDRPAAEEWEQFRTEGRRLWEILKRELGGRFRVVYLEVGRIFEPESSFE